MTKRRNIPHNNQMFTTFEDLFFAHYIYGFENFIGAFIVTDRNGIIRFMGSEAGLILGLRPSTAVGKPLNIMVPNSLLVEALATGITPDELKTSKIRRTINGRDLNCSIIALRFQGKTFALVENYLDDTYVNTLEAKIAELSKRNHLLELLLDQSFEELYAIDTQGRLTYITSRSAGNMGFDMSEVLGLDISELDSNSQLKEVTQTGITKTRKHSRPKKKELSVIEAPLIDDDSVIGAFLRSTYPDLNEEKPVSKPFRAPDKGRFREPPILMKSGCKFSIADIIGRSDAIENTRKKALRIAKGDSTVLITGESGTGKELFAHAIHVASVRKNKPFIRVNCASIPETLLEAELFGYEPGSFTGAQKTGKPGKFELAHNGTLFLDEAAEMPLSMQAKLLTVIQEGMFERIGGIASYEVNVRIIAATNKDLWEMVSSGKFREDLYYRLDVVNLQVPPLRDRLDDIPLLIQHFIPIINQSVKGHAKGVSDELLHIFNAFRWPGNVRELRNVLEAAINLSEEKMIEFNSLPLRIREKMGIQSRGKSKKVVEKISELKGGKLQEKQLMEETLKLTIGNRRQAAIHLNMPRSTFYFKLKKYGLM